MQIRCMMRRIIFPKPVATNKNKFCFVNDSYFDSKFKNKKGVYRLVMINVFYSSIIYIKLDLHYFLVLIKMMSNYNYLFLCQSISNDSEKMKIHRAIVLKESQ
mgnify:CR=1 FL=1